MLTSCDSRSKRCAWARSGYGRRWAKIKITRASPARGKFRSIALGTTGGPSGICRLYELAIPIADSYLNYTISSEKINTAYADFASAAERDSDPVIAVTSLQPAAALGAPWGAIFRPGHVHAVRTMPSGSLTSGFTAAAGVTEGPGVFDFDAKHRLVQKKRSFLEHMPGDSLSARSRFSLHSPLVLALNPG